MFTNSWRVAVIQHFDGLQHKGTMSTKPIFEKIAQRQRSYVPLSRQDCDFDTGTYYMTIIDKITTFCNDVNKTITYMYVELLAILRYVS